MVKGIKTLPKTLTISCNPHVLQIEDHQIVSMGISIGDSYDSKHTMFSFLASCISTCNTAMLIQMQKQELDINVLAEMCIREIRNDDRAVFEVLEHERGLFENRRMFIGEEINDLTSNGEHIMDWIYEDYVTSKILSKTKFKKVWKKLEISTCAFSVFMKERGTDIRSECIDALQRTKTYEELVNNLTPIMNSCGKKWSAYKEDCLRSAFAIRTRKNGGKSCMI